MTDSSREARTPQEGQRIWVDGHEELLVAQEGSALVEVEAIRAGIGNVLNQGGEIQAANVALDSLLARLESAERRLAQLGIVIDWRERAEAAEAERDRFEEALMAASIRIAGEEVGIDRAQAVYDECLAAARTEERA